MNEKLHYEKNSNVENEKLGELLQIMVMYYSEIAFSDVSKDDQRKNILRTIKKYKKT